MLAGWLCVQSGCLHVFMCMCERDSSGIKGWFYSTCLCHVNQRQLAGAILMFLLLLHRTPCSNNRLPYHSACWHFYWYIAHPSGNYDQCFVCFLPYHEQLVLNRIDPDFMLESLKTEEITKTQNSFYTFRESTLLPTFGSSNNLHQLRQTAYSL